MTGDRIRCEVDVSQLDNDPESAEKIGLVRTYSLADTYCVKMCTEPKEGYWYTDVGPCGDGECFTGEWGATGPLPWQLSHSSQPSCCHKGQGLSQL